MRTVEGHDIDVNGLLDAGESPTFAARPAYATVRDGKHWSGTTLLLTDRRFILTKDRLFGKAKADFAVAWNDVESVRGELWNGGGPKIQLLIENASTARPVELIVESLHAVEVESAIRTGYLSARR